MIRSVIGFLHKILSLKYAHYCICMEVLFSSWSQLLFCQNLYWKQKLGSGTEATAEKEDKEQDKSMFIQSTVSILLSAVYRSRNNEFHSSILKYYFQTLRL